MPAADRAAVREAFTLPLIFLTVALLGGFRSAATQGMRFLPPPLIALILATLLVGLLIRAGALAPERLLRSDRSPLENLSGTIVLAAFFAASGQVFNLMTPESGLLHFIVTVFFLLLLWNTWAASPDRARLLRSLAVLFGGAFILKYIVLASLYDPQGGLTKRVLMTLLEGVTLGGLQYEPPTAMTGYIAFFTLALYLIGVMLLPSRIQGSEFRVQGSEFKVQGSEFKVQGSRLEVQGSTVAVQGSVEPEPEP
jgi:hypothetical protein